ncbi:hypothetical protein [Ancylobacter sp. TS-1]|uniref:hypothetical protein n=1 Tax=Ancylobacter sp. TS-1 TaxID=1850374 RepID=UPI001265C43E|nr:hypothetical protein [Ancylobacter sp. TS-1]QFR32415.1 hypothetical protein GBB76_04385 [Ancylobacter sp. TS-1]
MSETAPIVVTLDQVRETARRIVNHQSSRGAIGVSVHHVMAMAQALCALDDIARLAAESAATRAEMHRAGVSGDAAGVHAADDRLTEIEAELHAELMTLGFIPTEQDPLQ